MRHLRENKTEVIWLVGLILLTLMIAKPVPVNALFEEFQLERKEVYTLNDFDYQTDQNFQGVQVDRTFNLALPGDWIVTDEAVLTIRFSHSPVLNPISSMSIRWNGSLVGSTRLTQDNAQQGILNITLPQENINPGFNELQIEFFMGIAEDFCIDFDNPAVWAVVHNDTSLELNYQREAQPSDLQVAPEILIDSSLLAENRITLVMPENPELDLVEALARIAGKLGQIAEWRNTNIATMTFNEARKTEPQGDLVVLAPLDQISNGFPELYNRITSNVNGTEAIRASLGPDDGVIFLVNSPFESNDKSLVLTGQDNQGVIKSVMAAVLDSFYDGTGGDWAVIRSVPDLPPNATEDDLAVSLQDLGIETQTASGTREQSIQFSLPLSARWDINTEAWLELHFAHSGLLNPDQSTLTVELNEIPVASIPLSAETAENGFSEIRVPLRYFDVGINTFVLRANLEHRDSREDYQDFCTDETYPRSWITIHSDTAVVFPEKPQTSSLELQHFPFGFSDLYSYHNFSFVLPPEFSTADLKAVGQLAVTMGKSLIAHPGGINVRVAEDLEGFEKIQYQILIGTADNLLTESLNNLLPLPLDLETGTPQPNPQIPVIETSSGIYGTLQAFQEEAHGTFLLLTGRGPESILAGASLLSTPSTRTALKGNLAVFTAQDIAMSFSIRPERTPPRVDPTRQPAGEQFIGLKGQSVWIVRISIGLAVVSLVILLIALIWKNRKSGES